MADADGDAGMFRASKGGSLPTAASESTPLKTSRACRRSIAPAPTATDLPYVSRPEPNGSIS
jgi:hypothetical protein